MCHLRKGYPLSGPGSRAPPEPRGAKSALADVDPYREDRRSMLKTLHRSDRPHSHEASSEHIDASR